MSDLSSRHSLESDLLRHRAAGDFAAQAETLLMLAELAKEEEASGLAQGLYGQAWAAYEQCGNRQGVLRVARAIGDLLRAPVNVMTGLTPETEIERPLWEREVLRLMFDAGDRQSQADTYAWISRNEGDWTAERWAIQRAATIMTYACYAMMGPVPSHIKTPTSLTQNSGFYVGPDNAFREEVLAAHCAHRDTEGAASILLAFGECGLWTGIYDEARQDLERARHLFEVMATPEQLKHTITRLMRLAYRLDNYQLYTECYAQLLALTQPSDASNRITLVLGLALVAADHHDWPTVRNAYQQAVIIAVGMNEARRQCSIYWQWGQAEYKVNHHAFGEALCLWSIALMQQYDPYHVSSYERQLKQMRVGIMP